MALSRVKLLTVLGLLVCIRGVVGSQELAITEFLAVGDAGVIDEDGDSPNWIEIQNAGPGSVDLDGWFLTDTANDLTQWSFPSVVLQPGDFLLVFASGKDRSEPGRELHTSFKLSAQGEFLALVRPNGFAVEHAYAPAYPPQVMDVSYGIGQVVTVASLVGGTTPTRVRVPSSGAADGSWFLPGFDDASWTLGTTRVGFDTETDPDPSPIPGANLALTGVATQSTTGYSGVASRAIDGNTSSVYSQSSITHTAVGDPAPSWQVKLQKLSPLDRIVLFNRSDCCSTRLSNFRVSVLDDADDVVYSEVFFPDGVGFPTPNVGFEIPLPAGTRGRTVRIEVLGPNAGGELYLCLAEVQVLEGIWGYGHLIETDLESSMLGVSSSARIRAGFTVNDPSELDTLTLKIRYDDGFVAYLNGEEVARRNAPAGAPAWNAAATSERPAGEALRIEEINLSGRLDLLRPGANVLAVHGMNVGSDDGDFLSTFDLVAASIEESGALFFPEPTPGRVNDTEGVLGFVADTRFSVDRGFYDAPFTVEITTLTEGAQIRYTTDGSVPTETRGSLYAGPIAISETTIVRAVAYGAGLEPTNVDTHTYIFLDDVIASNVMNKAITQDPTYGPQMRSALTDLPTISLSTASAVNGDVEVGVSMEWIPPDGSPGFQEDAGVRYYGGAFTEFAKKNFRLYFRAEWGASKLKFPLFKGHDHGIRPVEVFDQLELRGGSHDMNQRGFYMSNRFTDDTMLDMGDLNPHGQFVHLYINGTYWGQYHLRERWNADMLAQYLGGEKEDYEAINGNWNVGGWADPGVPYDGDGSAWTRIKSLRDDYEAIQPYLDVSQYVDYMLLFMFGNCEQEYRCVGPTSPGTGFKFYLNDADGFTRSVGARTSMGQPGRQEGDGPGGIFGMLLYEGHPDYVTLLGDRIHEHLFNDGAMTFEKNRERLLERCDQVERAFIAEAARWGYRTPASWVSAKNDYVNNVLSTRTEAVIGHFRAARFYPTVEAPTFNRHGGDIDPGFVLTMSAPAGVTYYTLDGTDPRLPGGALSPDALVAGAFETSVVLEEGADVRVLVPQNDTLGLDWTQPGFDATAWIEGRTGVGYETGTGYEGHFQTDLVDVLYNRNSSVYLRVEFDLPADFVVNGKPALAAMFLQMKYDDGYVAYVNGQQIAARNAPAALTWDARATSNHSDNLAVQFESVEVSSAIASLRTQGNVLAIQGLNTTASGSDFLIVPRIVGVAGSQGIVLGESTRVKARALDGSKWSALNEAAFIVGMPLRITEILYHPAPPPTGSPFEEGDFEFVELQNVGQIPLDLTGVRLDGGIAFDFAGSEVSVLQPGAVVVVVKNLEAFASRYPSGQIVVAGAYDGRLENRGDELILRGPFDEAILRFEYADSWYEEANGFGPSLVIVDPTRPATTWGNAANWRVSDFSLGSPGVDESGAQLGGWQVPGDINQDLVLDLSDAVGLLLHLFGGKFETLPCGAGTLAEEGNRSLLDSNGDTTVDLSDAVHVLNYLFVAGGPPALGSECTPIPGCFDSCR